MTSLCFFILTLQLQLKCFQINNSMRWILTLNKLHKIVDNPCNTISHFCPKIIKNAPISIAVHFYSFISRTITASYVYLYKILSNNKEQETAFCSQGLQIIVGFLGEMNSAFLCLYYQFNLNSLRKLEGNLCKSRTYGQRTDSIIVTKLYLC